MILFPINITIVVRKSKRNLAYNVISTKCYISTQGKLVSMNIQFMHREARGSDNKAYKFVFAFTTKTLLLFSFPLD